MTHFLPGRLFCRARRQVYNVGAEFRYFLFAGHILGRRRIFRDALTCQRCHVNQSFTRLTH
jgi:hypothetical protein